MSPRRSVGAMIMRAEMYCEEMSALMAVCPPVRVRPVIWIGG